MVVLQVRLNIPGLPDGLFSQFLVNFGGPWNVKCLHNIWNILQPFGIVYANLEQFMVIWYIFPVLVCLDQEKSGNPTQFKQ
jgi:hypothetical protein